MSPEVDYPQEINVFETDDKSKYIDSKDYPPANVLDFEDFDPKVFKGDFFSIVKDSPNASIPLVVNNELIFMVQPKLQISPYYRERKHPILNYREEQELFDPVLNKLRRSGIDYSKDMIFLRETSILILRGNKSDLYDNSQHLKALPAALEGLERSRKKFSIKAYCNYHNEPHPSLLAVRKIRHIKKKTLSQLKTLAEKLESIYSTY